MTSTSWIIVIVIGVALVAVANIQYPRAKDAEDKAAMAKQAMSLIKPELVRNYEYLSKQDTSKGIAVIIESPFETVAWQTVSNSDLLLGLDKEKLSNIMHAYYLINRANTLHSKLIESSVGISSAMSKPPACRPTVLFCLSRMFM